MRKGWFKVYRYVENEDFYKKKPFDEAHALFDLMLMASYKDTDKQQKGEVWTSLRSLSDRWGWSVNRIQHFLDKLAKNGYLKKQGNKNGYTKGTRILLYFSQKQEVKETQTDTETDTNRRNISLSEIYISDKEKADAELPLNEASAPPEEDDDDGYSYGVKV